MRHLNSRFFLALVLGLGVAAGGCDSKTAATPTQAKPPGPVRKVATPADGLSPHLVTAVTTAKGGAAMLQVKFELQARPEVGDPVDVDLVIVPAADNIDSVSGTIQAEDGLEVVSGETIAPVEKLVFGTPIHHSLKVKAKRDGIFTLSALMTVQSGAETLGPIYTMPVIAGNGLATAGAAPAPTQAASRPTAKATPQ